jgi:hypothetical protein
MPFYQNNKRESKLDSFNYRAFLLRCWQETIPTAGMESSWRFSITHIDGLQKEKGFSSLEELLEYVQTELAKREFLVKKD